MVFYRCYGTVTDECFENYQGRAGEKELARDVYNHSEHFNNSSSNESFFFVCDITEDCLTAGAIIVEEKDFDCLSDYLKELKVTFKGKTRVEEVTISNIIDMLEDSTRNKYIGETDAVLERYGLNIGRLSHNFRESIIRSESMERVMACAEKALSRDTLIPELKRIYSDKNSQKYYGHPVHYIYQADDENSRRGVLGLVLQALYSQNRIKNRRYCFTDISSFDYPNERTLDKLYKLSLGGTVIIRFFERETEEDEDLFSSAVDAVEVICKVMKRYRNQVLTILSMPQECEKTKALFYDNLAGVSFVEIKEASAFGKDAVSYLEELAKSHGVEADTDLCGKIAADRGYLSGELNDLFNVWYDERLKNVFYPAYLDVKQINGKIAVEKPKGNAYSELMEMVGLSEAKKVINQMLDYYKAQRLFAQMGISNEKPTRHCIFTGHPGTAKTTVARLFAQIMKDNGLLASGQFIECGRADLVDRYVGGTAPRVKKKFADASGGCLFLDEIYSLVDDRNGSFGDEAINTIVQEMENHRDDVIVIFAGYPDKMEGFLNKNPGLRSRIAFHIPFEDYSSDELLQIARLQAKKKNLIITDDACVKMSNHFDTVRTDEDFGNGRYVRNVLEKALMVHASRIVSTDYSKLTAEDVKTITADDILFSDIQTGTRKPARRIGFCA